MDAWGGLDEEEEPQGLDDAIPQTADEIVSASLLSGALSDACDIEIEVRPLDVEEEELIKTFIDRGCSCDLGPHKTPCCKSFSVDHYLSLRCAFAEMTHDELDMIVMGQVMATCHLSSTAESSEAPEITRNIMRYYHQGVAVCRRTFLFIHNIGLKRFKNVKASYHRHGPAARVHGNKGRRRKGHLSLQQVKDVVQYIQTYTGW